MAFTYDPTTDAGKVRLIIGDTDSAKAKFTDADVAGFLALEDGSVRLAAAAALEAWARSLMKSSVKLGDYSNDPSKAADSMKALAVQLRDRESSAPACGVIQENLGPMTDAELRANEIFIHCDDEF